MKREPRLTKKERKALFGSGPKPPPPATQRSDDEGANPIGAVPSGHTGDHIHCLACGKHLETVGEARARSAKGLQSTVWMSIRCAHGSEFQCCMGCVDRAKQLLDEHDRTGEGVRAATPWH